MFVAPCPHCGDSVTVPARARPTSRVRCPLCTSEFTLDDMLSKLPPALELLDEPAGAWHEGGLHAAQAGGDDDVATLVADGSHDDIGIAEAEPRAERPTYLGEETTTETAPRKLKTAPRPKKPQKNMVLEVVKVVLGGLAAIPIAQLILWWAAGTDPMETGPIIAKYVPAVVPQKFHKSEAQKDKEERANKPNGAKPSRPNNTSKPPANLPKLENTDIPSFDLPKTEDKNTSKKPTIDEPLGFDLSEEPSKKQPEPAKIEPLEKPEPASPEKAEAVVVRDAPRYSAVEVAEALKNANKAVQTWNERGADATPTQQTDLLRAAYTALAQLGEKLSYADRSDKKLENDLPQIREMLFALQADMDVMTIISRAGPAWLSPTRRTTPGILIVGKVEKVEQQGKLYESEIVLEDPMMTKVRVVSTQDPKDSFKAGDRAMVLGVLVLEPSNIVGYEQDVPFAILSGMANRVAE
jgi:hypothetical protein